MKSNRITCTGTGGWNQTTRAGLLCQSWEMAPELGCARVGDGSRVGLGDGTRVGLGDGARVGLGDGARVGLQQQDVAAEPELK